MAVIVIMPKQGQSVESCIVTEIKKGKGESVKKGDILFSYETDKASFEEESPADGVVLELFYDEGDEVPVLENMMIIGELGEDYSALISGEARPSESAEDTSTTDSSQLAAGATAAPDTDLGSDVGKTESLPGESPKDGLRSKADMAEAIRSDEKILISPRARKLAEREAVNLDLIEGSGPKGRIIEKDLQRYIDSRPKMTPLAKRMASEERMVPKSVGTGLGGKIRSVDMAVPENDFSGIDYEDRKISNMRRIIAKAMHSSLQNSAQLTHHLAADARNILSLREKVKAALDKGETTANITLNDMVCFAVIMALKQFPEVNTHFLGDSKRYFKKIHLGLAVDTERGLMVPAIRNADDLSITGLSNRMREVAGACRTGNVNPDLLSSEAATFTVSNLGNYGVEMFTPVINLPQSAILGVNRILPRPKDLGGSVYAFVPHIGLSLTYDHRSLDGGEATRFLKQIAIEIENLKFEI